MRSYNDEAPAQPAPAPAADPEPTAAAPVAEPVTAQQEDYSNYNQATEGDAGDDSHMNGGEEYEDDDDDVDFNLGNGGGASRAPDNDSYDNDTPGPSHHKGANSKEEG